MYVEVAGHDAASYGVVGETRGDKLSINGREVGNVLDASDETLGRSQTDMSS